MYESQSMMVLELHERMVVAVQVVKPEIRVNILVLGEQKRAKTTLYSVQPSRVAVGEQLIG
jgi:hypothetical protein